MSSDLLDQQLAYYRARAGEYDQWFLRQGRYDRGPELNRRWFEEVRTLVGALDAFAPRGDVLELACGTGLWTERLAARATHITAVDGSPEVLALNRERLRTVAGAVDVTHVEADLFAWEPPAQRFDVVFFSFWLSHVPPEHFEAFWSMVRRALRPGGRFFLIDSRHEPSSTAVNHTLPDPSATTVTRKLNDGREFEICKVFYEPATLRARLSGLGWRVEVSQTPTYFLHASGQRAQA
jgi:ubiquinone/menaquinone biosynthesis C-methylase UbiE